MFKGTGNKERAFLKEKSRCETNSLTRDIKLSSNIISPITINTNQIMVLQDSVINKLDNYEHIADLHLLLNTLFTAFRQAFIFTDRHDHSKLQKEFCCLWITRDWAVFHLSERNSIRFDLN